MSNETEDKKNVSRRSFLGLASLGAIILSALSTFGGILRFTKANVYYEESKRFKIGKPDMFPVGFIKSIEDQNVFIFSDNDGFHAISRICTHLGCIVALTEIGMACPCHGSKYNRNGKVVGGPAPRSLPWLEISQNIDGTLVVDAAREVKQGTTFKV